MKTKTSKKGIWLRSMLLLPILAILLFSFSTKVTVLEEKHNLTEIEKIILQEIASKKQVKEYNTLARKYNKQPEDKRVIKLKDVKRLEFLYGLMSEAQKKNAEPFPNCPPPPPPAPDAPKVINVKELPPPPPIPENATPEQKKKYNKAIKNYKVKTEQIAHQEARIAAKLKYVENKNQLKTEKLAYKETQIAARVEKIKAEKGELVRVRELQKVENRNQLQESKLAYKQALIEVKTLKQEQLKKEKEAYKKLKEKEKSQKNKSDKKEN